jgi:hypothetical protein
MSIYRKTDAGEREILQKSNALDLLHRSVLLMIDGKRDVALISKSLGSLGNVDTAVSALAEKNLITLVSAAIATTKPGTIKAELASATTPVLSTAAADTSDYLNRLFAAKSATTVLVRRTLEAAMGPSADPLMLKVESALNAAMFRQAIESALHVIGQVRGAGARDNLANSLRALAEKTSS